MALENSYSIVQYSSFFVFVLLQESDESRRRSVRVLGLQQLHLLHQPEGRRSLGGRLLPNQRGPSKQSGENENPALVENSKFENTFNIHINKFNTFILNANQRLVLTLQTKNIVAVPRLLIHHRNKQVSNIS